MWCNLIRYTSHKNFVNLTTTVSSLINGKSLIFKMAAWRPQNRLNRKNQKISGHIAIRYPHIKFHWNRPRGYETCLANPVVLYHNMRILCRKLRCDTAYFKPCRIIKSTRRIHTAEIHSNFWRTYTIFCKCSQSLHSSHQFQWISPSGYKTCSADRLRLQR
jgi:hypothetical protein